MYTSLVPNNKATRNSTVDPFGEGEKDDSNHFSHFLQFKLYILFQLFKLPHTQKNLVLLYSGGYSIYNILSRKKSLRFHFSVHTAYQQL